MFYVELEYFWASLSPFPVIFSQYKSRFRGIKLKVFHITSWPVPDRVYFTRRGKTERLVKKAHIVSGN